MTGCGRAVFSQDLYQRQYSIAILTATSAVRDFSEENTPVRGIRDSESFNTADMLGTAIGRVSDSESTKDVTISSDSFRKA